MVGKELFGEKMPFGILEKELMEKNMCCWLIMES